MSRVVGCHRAPALSLALASCLAAPALADPLMCQARGGLTGVDMPPMQAAFYALVDGGLPPYRYH